MLFFIVTHWQSLIKRGTPFFLAFILDACLRDLSLLAQSNIENVPTAHRQTKKLRPEANNRTQSTAFYTDKTTNLTTHDTR